ncbi:phosphoribosylanthranilate isomerase [Roseomonas sp. NAR14]|uniref:N-(5'-phosphoribosyl)anthranilate isomerase n=1 Tax=Roseomonas acroporae TaxID=2937791 RepID=A0A9X1Y8R1_9PROT|nr:phosphoribosylanthranilate isomerase [Roseomonas acroporae]MCK8785182.1 phosphoribosylanthranilate isomerase [Roseomonas acroporae]
MVKICGINDAAGFDAALAAGADLVGFVFFPPSPRAVSPAVAASLSARQAGGAGRVGLFVDPDDALLEAVLAALPLDLIQLHGAESPERCAMLRARFGRPVMKALGIAAESDLAALDRYAGAVDRFLLDAKPVPGDALPGGNARRFDWSLPTRRRIPLPWLLAGGLTPANVADAIAESGAPGVDVSSGVERARGVKDPAMVAAFVASAHAAPDAAPRRMARPAT